MTRRATVHRDLAAAPHDVVRRLADPALAHARATSDPMLHGEVLELADGPDGPVVTIAAGLPEAWLPSVGRQAPGSPRVVRREAWRLDGDGAVADVEVRTESIPATTMTVTGYLDPTPTGSVLQYDLALSVALPVVGGAIERAVLDQVVRAYERECDVIADACS